MQVQLNQTDIEEAISKHLFQMGFQTDVVDIHFTAGRKGAGLTAEVNLGSKVKPEKPQFSSEDTNDLEESEPLANIFN